MGDEVDVEYNGDTFESITISVAGSGAVELIGVTGEMVPGTAGNVIEGVALAADALVAYGEAVTDTDSQVTAADVGGFGAGTLVGYSAGFIPGVIAGAYTEVVIGGLQEEVPPEAADPMRTAADPLGLGLGSNGHYGIRPGPYSMNGLDLGYGYDPRLPYRNQPFPKEEEHTKSSVTRNADGSTTVESVNVNTGTSVTRTTARNSSTGEYEVVSRTVVDTTNPDQMSYSYTGNDYRNDPLDPRTRVQHEEIRGSTSDGSDRKGDTKTGGGNKDGGGTKTTKTTKTSGNATPKNHSVPSDTGYATRGVNNLEGLEAACAGPISLYHRHGSGPDCRSWHT